MRDHAMMCGNAKEGRRIKISSQDPPKPPLFQVISDILPQVHNICPLSSMIILDKEFHSL